MPPAAEKIIYEIWALFNAEAMKGQYVTKQVMVGGMVIQKDDCLNLSLVNTSSRTGGSTRAMMGTNRLYAPGLAECRVLTEDKYFTDPIAGEVYRVSAAGPLVKLADSPQMSKKTQKMGENKLERYTVELRTNSGDSGGKKKYPLARVIYSSVFPFFAPLSTMDHIDGHQFNGIHNISNCPKKENLARGKGKKFIPTALIVRSG
jgi:hypothetical protein